eukprot:8591816-Heterocapsa_arctica.AAC.1
MLSRTRLPWSRCVVLDIIVKRLDVNELSLVRRLRTCSDARGACIGYATATTRWLRSDLRCVEQLLWEARERCEVNAPVKCAEFTRC